MTATKDTPGMLQVRSQNYAIGQWTGSKGLVRRSEYVNPGGVNVSGSTYALEPTYGWRKVVSQPVSAINWKDAVKPVIAPKMTPAPYQIERYPGFMLKSLMEGNPLEK
jgi:hypothetical protein